MELRRRKGMRLENRDYSRDGYYFITMCVKDRWPILCSDSRRISDTGGFPLSEIGELVEKHITGISSSYQNARLDKHIIMPNHVHLILILDGQDKDGMHTPIQRTTVSRIIQTTKGIINKSLGYSIWQKSFHDHIIRTEADYQRIWDYIAANPLRWEDDCYYEPPAAHRETLHVGVHQEKEED